MGVVIFGIMALFWDNLPLQKFRRTLLLALPCVDMGSSSSKSLYLTQLASLPAEMTLIESDTEYIARHEKGSWVGGRLQREEAADAA